MADDPAPIAGRDRVARQLARRESALGLAPRRLQHGGVAPGSLGHEPLLDQHLVHEGVPEDEAVAGESAGSSTTRPAATHCARADNASSSLMSAAAATQAHVELLADDGRPADDITLRRSEPGCTGRESTRRGSRGP